MAEYTSSIFFKFSKHIVFTLEASDVVNWRTGCMAAKRYIGLIQLINSTQKEEECVSNFIKITKTER